MRSSVLLLLPESIDKDPSIKLCVKATCFFFAGFSQARDDFAWIISAIHNDFIPSILRSGLKDTSLLPRSFTTSGEGDGFSTSRYTCVKNTTRYKIRTRVGDVLKFSQYLAWRPRPRLMKQNANMPINAVCRSANCLKQPIRKVFDCVANAILVFTVQSRVKGSTGKTVGIAEPVKLLTVTNRMAKCLPFQFETSRSFPF
ncbi:hypothetical protein Hypma_013992 [Hypsizygus marmoreus]|uniref:Uncharacterized protein n=1 Tax=Hypsizygus marmoreus TaxID=39966 RepID=A0A369KB69_HYPMA|nr:hypothetical protein Hypma_013992 [Hypsizygus marmoreus]